MVMCLVFLLAQKRLSQYLVFIHVSYVYQSDFFMEYTCKEVCCHRFEFSDNVSVVREANNHVCFRTDHEFSIMKESQIIVLFLASIDGYVFGCFLDFVAQKVLLDTFITRRSFIHVTFLLIEQVASPQRSWEQ